MAGLDTTGPEPKSCGRSVCAVAMCTETATRAFIKNKFQAHLCPCHQRFVYTFPFIHRCQYSKSVIDEVILRAYVLYFQPGSPWPAAQHLPDSDARNNEAEFPDGIACCKNRATRVVLVGDVLNQCKVYLFCHGHHAQVRTQASGFDAKPSEAKNEPYMSGALLPAKAEDPPCMVGVSGTTKVDEDDTRTESVQPSQPSPIAGSTSGESASSSGSEGENTAITTSAPRDPNGKSAEVQTAEVKSFTKYPNPLPSGPELYRRGLKEVSAVLDQQQEVEKGHLLPKAARDNFSKLTMQVKNILNSPIDETQTIKQLQQENDLDKCLENQLHDIMGAHHKRVEADGLYQLHMDTFMREEHVYDRLPPLLAAGTTRFETWEDRKTEEAIRYYIRTWNAIAALYDRQYWPIRWLLLLPVVKMGVIALTLLGRWLGV